MKALITSIQACFLFAVGAYFFTGLASGQTGKTEHGKDEPTLVQRGRFTEKQREYSKEFKKRYPSFHGLKIDELIQFAKEKPTKEEVGVYIGVGSIPTIGYEKVPTASSYLTELSCGSDLIIRGQIQHKTAYLTDDETFAYTDYDFLVNDVLKNNSDSSIKTDQIIQITRPGGLVKLEDQVVRYEDRSFKPLTIGDEYLLFLKYLPSANGYIPARFDGDFLLQGNKFFQDSIKALPPELRNSDDSQFLLGSVQSAVSIGCTN